LRNFTIRKTPCNGTNTVWFLPWSQILSLFVLLPQIATGTNISSADSNIVYPRACSNWFPIRAYAVIIRSWCSKLQTAIARMHPSKCYLLSTVASSTFCEHSRSRGQSNLPYGLYCAPCTIRCGGFVDLYSRQYTKPAKPDQRVFI
jgi:hypothetical protein